MRAERHKKHRRTKAIAAAATAMLTAAALLLCAALMAAVPAQTARAESAVDTLTIKVGYSGMDLDRYVTAGEWNWRELYNNLPLESRSYSYFQLSTSQEAGVPADSAAGDVIHKKKYNSIVDAANGFYITDLLNYAGLYISDIQNLGFYVNDHNTIWASFDTSSLFGNRYYFNNLPAHRTETEDGYDFSDAWTDCELVEPMLAIEDNWASFTQDFENIAPDFNDVKPGNRFHLMYGQKAPTEQMTRESAKYISCVYVTMKGKPAFSTKDIKLSGKIGRHTARMTSQVDNEAMIRQLADLLDLQSTDESVLKIKDIHIERDENYSDLATVVIDYDIVGKGKAQIVGSFGGNADDYSFETETVEGGSGGGKKNPDRDKEKPAQKDQKKTSGSKNKNKGTSPGGSRQAPSGSGTIPRAGTYGGSGLSRPVASSQINTPGTTRSAQTSEKVAAARKTLPGGVFKLSDQLRDQLNGLSDRDEVVIPGKEDTTKLEMKDDRKEVKRHERVRAVMAAVGCAGFMGAGAFWEEISFRLKLRGKRSKTRKRRVTA